MSLVKNQIIPLSITDISSDGNGVGHHDGQAVFVPAAAVGDVLQVKIVKAAPRYAYGRLEKIITPGPGRQKMDCPIGRVCGGCCFRHLTYEAELAAKQRFVADALSRLGKIEAPVLPILPSPAMDRYRNKVQYPVAAGPDGLLTYGFFAQHSHRVVPCADCLLQPEILNQIATRTAQLLQQAGAAPYDETSHTGLIRHIYLRIGAHTGQVMLCLVVTGFQVPGAEMLTETLTAEFPAIRTILLNRNPDNTNVICGPDSRVLFGDGSIQDTLAGVPVRLDEKSFAQVNSAGAQQLFAVVRRWAAATPDDRLLDLYCGAGVIGLSMAASCHSLTGVEVVPEAVAAAQASATEMNLTNTRFLCADAATAATALLNEGYSPTIAVLDPPRKGADLVTLQALVSMAPRRIVMVSCNPATLARDLAILQEKGYQTQQVQPVDMFPRTRHVEAVALLTKR